MKNVPVIKALYRHLLRWADRPSLCGVHFTVSNSDLVKVMGEAGEKWDDVQDSEGVKQVVRHTFKMNKSLNRIVDQQTISTHIDQGFAALRMLYGHYSRSIDHLVRERDARVDRSGIEFGIGTVFRHKKFGYRGVIMGWDRTCDKTADWRRRMGTDKLPGGMDQPFYMCLPDEVDSMQLFRGYRESKYVAQDNIGELEPAEPRRIKHRHLGDYFVAFCESQQRYIPHQSIQYVYPEPGGYDSPKLVPIDEDTDILGAEEEAAGAVAPKRGRKGRGRAGRPARGSGGAVKVKSGAEPEEGQ